MLNLAGGLILYHFLMWFIPILFVLFVVIPFVMGLFNGKGWVHNAGEVGHACLWVLSAGFKKRPQSTSV